MISIRDNKMRWAISTLLALLILFGTYRNVFSLAAFLLMGLMLVFCDRETSLLQMFFVMPMANIFKLAPNVQSFFTIIMLVYVVLHLVLPRKATALVILFALYVVVGELFTGSFNFFRTIKLICNFLFLSSVLNSKVEVRSKEIFLSYILGNLTASVFGLLDSPFFKIESYIGVQSIGNPDYGEMVVRFAGLYADPNYYTVGIIISLCLLVVLFYRNQINMLFLFLISIPLVGFLIVTYSKSAIIMFFLPFGIFLYSLFKKKKYSSMIVLSLLMVMIVALALSGYVEIFDVVLNRIAQSETAEGVNINTLTTGRFDLWLMYFKYIVKNIGVSIFGCGISSGLLNGRAAHNTYLDVFYYLGICGGLILTYLFAAISSQSRRLVVKRNIVNYSILICIVIMYFFLSSLFYFDPPFHIFLAVTVLNLSEEKKTAINSVITGEKNEHSRI